ncbi:GatB/YqeY domain-containing protein [Aulographum hederae CBS 113979]|uniref:Altered inheritance of mitochondria protein 41 n=1 Tax=Aulographum hederae CBS 113979 TaxID=1176131 RepID=A0A6G1GP47_9PEZI|nr:GatB/YqeY domain-containing protein [Aulographum hederae CBS 113979]
MPAMKIRIRRTDYNNITSSITGNGFHPPLQALRPCLFSTATLRKPLSRLPIAPSRIRSGSQSLYSTAAPPPNKLLSALRDDLKTAMRAKDAPRLAVLRSVLAEISMSFKGSTPIESDVQLLPLLRKRLTSADASMKEFEGAGRQDLVEKERTEKNIIEGYVGTLEEEMMREDEIAAIVKGIVKDYTGPAGKIDFGKVMKEMMKIVDGQMVDKKMVSKVCKETLQN